MLTGLTEETFQTLPSVSLDTREDPSTLQKLSEPKKRNYTFLNTGESPEVSERGEKKSWKSKHGAGEKSWAKRLSSVDSSVYHDSSFKVAPDPPEKMKIEDQAPLHPLLAMKLQPPEPVKIVPKDPSLNLRPIKQIQKFI